MSAEIHPFDVHQLAKGQWIPPDKCEAVLGVPRTDKKYPLKLLSLKEELERQWLEYRDEIITLTCRRDGLYVCTDDEAVEENRRRRRGHVRGLERTQVRQMGVDVSRLTTPELRSQHERECVVGAAFLLGGKREARVALKPHRRVRPGLLKSGSK